MKTTLHLTSLVILAFFLTFPASVRAQNNPLSPAYGQDVILYEGTGIIIYSTEVAVAQNGWIYVLVHSSDPASGNTFFYIFRSTDGGATFGQEISTGSYNGADLTLIHVDMVVTGDAPGNIRLWVAATVNNNPAGTYQPSCWVMQLDADGNFINVPYLKSDGTISKFYYVSIATDYRSPGSGSSPFAIALAFTGHSILGDVLFYTSSLDGGLTWNEYALELVPGEDMVGRVSLALGRTEYFVFGIYAIAFETNKTGLYGDIGVMMNYTDNLGFAWTEPVLVNHTHPNVIGNARYPTVALMDNAGINPANTALMPLIVAYEDRSSGPADIMYNSLTEYYGVGNQPGLTDFSAFWIGTNNTSDDIQPGLSFDKTYNNFLLTYYSTDGYKLQYSWIGINGILSGNWTAPSNYRDATTPFTFNPFPSLDINHTKALACFAWTDYDVPGNSQKVYFDSQWSTVGIPEPASSAASFSLQPNPAWDKVVVSIKKEGSYEVTISSLMGQVVLKQLVTEGGNTLKIEKLDAGVYFVRVTGEGMDETRKLVVN